MIKSAKDSSSPATNLPLRSQHSSSCVRAALRPFLCSALDGSLSGFFSTNFCLRDGFLQDTWEDQLSVFREAAFGSGAAEKGEVGAAHQKSRAAHRRRPQWLQSSAESTRARRRGSAGNQLSGTGLPSLLFCVVARYLDHRRRFGWKS